MNDIVISIIIPVYNKKDKLKECLDSVLSQTYKNIEVIIIDDGSVDGSDAICDNYAEKDKRVVVKHIKNCGVSKARNVGINMSHGDYIQFVDADDFINSDMTEKLYRMICDDHSDMAICGYNQIVKGKRVASIIPQLIGKQKNINYYKIIDTYRLDPLCGSPCNRLIKSEIIKKNNIRFVPEISFAEDFTFVIDCVKEINSFSSTQESLYNYNIDVSNSLSKVTKQKIEESWIQQELFIAHLYEILSSSRLLNEYNELLSSIYFSLISNSLNSRITNNYSSRDIKKWVLESINDYNWFSIKRIKINSGRMNNDYNGKKRRVGLVQQRFLYFCIRLNLLYLYIGMNKSALFLCKH